MKRIIVAAMFGISLLLPFPKTTAMADTPVMPTPMMDSRAVALGKFFESRNCPLLPYVDDFIAAADKYQLDYRLLPSISVIESQCGKIYPRKTNNPFGWNSARTGFESIPAAIDFITGQLANSRYYTKKSITQKLHAYCPNPTYPSRVENLMNQIK
jgi:hypothetical protein